MRSWDIAVSVQTSSKASNYCTEQNRVNRKKQNKPYSVMPQSLPSCCSNCQRWPCSLWGPIVSWVAGTGRCCSEFKTLGLYLKQNAVASKYLTHSQTKQSVLGVQRHLPGWGWQSYRIASDIRGFQVGWFKAALWQKGLLHFKTIVAKLLWREKQTFTCILEMECSFQMTFHFPVS